MHKSLFPFFLLFLISCKEKEQEANSETEPFFPIKSYIQSQVAHIDTSLYTIRLITTQNNQTDTAFIHRNAFREQAKDFLDIPDITQKKWRDDYAETKLFDEELQSAVISYAPKDEDAEIRRQEVIIKPSANEGDQVKTIFIDRILEKGSSTIKQKMLWEVNKWFRIVTITQTPNQPEKIQTKQVVWTEGPSANKL